MSTINILSIILSGERLNVFLLMENRARTKTLPTYRHHLPGGTRWCIPGSSWHPKGEFAEVRGCRRWEPLGLFQKLLAIAARTQIPWFQLMCSKSSGFSPHLWFTDKEQTFLQPENMKYEGPFCIWSRRDHLLLNWETFVAVSVKYISMTSEANSLIREIDVYTIPLRL